MADNNSVNRDTSPNVAEDDPFAELARIMNQGAQDDTPARADEQAAEADPFAVDLEKELLGDLEEVDAALDEVDAAYADERVGGADFEATDDIVDSGRADEHFDFGDEGTRVEPYATYGASDDQAAYDNQPAYEPEELPAEPAARETESYTGTEASLPAQDDYWMDAQPLTDQPVEPVSEPDPWRAEGGHADVDDSMLADVDMDFGDLDATEQPAPEEPSAPAEDIPAQIAEAAQETPQTTAGATSLEDELEMLLGGGSSEPEMDKGSIAEETQPDNSTTTDNGGPASSEAFPEPAHPQKSSIFTRANLPGIGGLQAQPTASDGALTTAEDHVQAAEPEPAADGNAFVPITSIAPDASDAHEIEIPPADVPVDFETVDVPEPALAQHDDLELPEIPVEEPAAHGPADEFEAEFAYDFPDAVASPDRSYEPEHFEDETLAADPADGDDRLYAEALGFSTSAGAAPVDADVNRELEAAIAERDAFAIPPDDKPSRRNGFMIAGAVLGVALLGGIGAFVLSLGGDDPGAPVLVEADNDPTKIKPDDPGGSAAVPNQDSVAYDAATGAGGGEPPQQESLVTTTEEPVDVASRVIDAGQLPGVDENAQSPLDGASGKMEDRLAATDSATASEIADDVIAVQPRKVRTMIVRPDGTLVPREEAEPASAATAPVESAPAENAVATPVITPAPAQSETVAATEEQPVPATEDSGDEATVAAAGQEDAVTDGSDASAGQQTASEVTPRVGPVAPSRPASQEEASQQVAQAAPAATRTQPAAPAPVAAADSEWSMQIASQPTAESAQTTYQELARRYGELLGGRGVNIVRAEIPGKGTYYRVRIPTSSRNDGISLCERYKAAGGSCFVSK